MSKTLRNILITLCILAMLLSIISVVIAGRNAASKTTAPETEISQEPVSGGETPAGAGVSGSDEAEDIQYVMYLGTNDKDTNEPVFPPEEAKEKAEEILLDHFGGFTIQEANGGWKDGDKVYSEYTLVIYLSDTDLESVHAAADEMIKMFNQSSVLIQANKTTTEFYDGALGGFDVSDPKWNFINWDADGDGKEEELEFEFEDNGDEAPSVIIVTMEKGNKELTGYIDRAYGLNSVVPKEDEEGPYLDIKYEQGDYYSHDSEGQCTLRLRNGQLAVDYIE